ncbi:MAG: hypothetical protein KUL82_09205 [Bdellovibrio sp.]|nr:hypothetical protein [Bdellovibrio sp.]
MKNLKEALLLPAFLFLGLSLILWNLKSLPLLRELPSRFHFQRDLMTFRLYAQDLLENPQICRRTLQNFFIFYDGHPQKHPAIPEFQSSFESFPLTSQKLKIRRLWLEKAQSENTVSKVDNKTYSVMQTQLILEVTNSEGHFSGFAKIPLSITTGPESSKEILDCASVPHP